jgi:hypothetical protein
MICVLHACATYLISLSRAVSAVPVYLLHTSEHAEYAVAELNDDGADSRRSA